MSSEAIGTTGSRTRGAAATRVTLGALVGLAIIVAPASANVAGTGAAAERVKPAEHPNIVLIVTDDQAMSTVRPSTMPALHRELIARGTSFSDAIVTSPLCCPSRAGTLTGQYNHNNGVLRNDYEQLREKRNTLATWLSRAGYRTIHVGKWLNLYKKGPGPAARPAPGWDVWQTIIEPNRYYDYRMSANGRKAEFGARDRDYVTNVLNRKAARIARRSARRERPFYLQLDHWAPHNGADGRGSGICHQANDPIPAPSDENAFATAPLPRPASFNEEDLSDKPTFLREQPPMDVALLERNYRCALASLGAVDRGIAKLQRALGKVDALRETVFVFTSDNGVFYGEHRVRHKVLPYEEALRVPLVVSSPRRYLSGAPRVARVDEPVANIDLAPTILELADARPCRRKQKCRTLDGRSLVPLLEGNVDAWPADRGLAVEYTGQDHGYTSCSYRGIRTPNQLYVEHYLLPDGDGAPQTCRPGFEAERYDLRVDPLQLDNLHPPLPGTAAAAEQQRLAGRLAALKRCSGIPGRDPQEVGRAHCE